LLRYRLDDQVRVGEPGGTDGERDPPQQRVPVGLGQLAPGHGPVGRPGEDRPAALQRGIVDLHRLYLDAVTREDLDDAGTHRAQADHTDPAEIPGHAALPNRRTPANCPRTTVQY